MVKNDKGQVALVYRQPIPQVVKVGNAVYMFDVKRAVSLAWVNEEDAPEILSITRTCCGGRRNVAYTYASDGQVRVWSGTGR